MEVEADEAGDAAHALLDAAKALHGCALDDLDQQLEYIAGVAAGATQMTSAPTDAAGRTALHFMCSIGAKALCARAVKRREIVCAVARAQPDALCVRCKSHERTPIHELVDGWLVNGSSARENQDAVCDGKSEMAEARVLAEMLRQLLTLRPEAVLLTDRAGCTVLHLLSAAPVGGALSPLSLQAVLEASARCCSSCEPDNAQGTDTADKCTQVTFAASPDADGCSALHILLGADSEVPRDSVAASSPALLACIAMLLQTAPAIVHARDCEGCSVAHALCLADHVLAAPVSIRTAAGQNTEHSCGALLLQVLGANDVQRAANRLMHNVWPSTQSSYQIETLDIGGGAADTHIHGSATSTAVPWACRCWCNQLLSETNPSTVPAVEVGSKINVDGLVGRNRIDGTKAFGMRDQFGCLPLHCLASNRSVCAALVSTVLSVSPPASPSSSFESLDPRAAAAAVVAATADQAGRLPLHRLCRNPCADFDAVKILLQAFPKAACLPDAERLLPVQGLLQVAGAGSSAGDEDYQRLVRLLLEAGNDGSSTSMMNTPLHADVDHGREAVLQDIAVALDADSCDGAATCMAPLSATESTESNTVLGLYRNRYMITHSNARPAYCCAANLDGNGDMRHGSCMFVDFAMDVLNGDAPVVLRFFADVADRDFEADLVEKMALIEVENRSSFSAAASDEHIHAVVQALRVVEVFSDERRGTVSDSGALHCVVLPAETGTVDSLLSARASRGRGLTLAQVQHVALPIARQLQCLHAKSRIVLGDIRPATVGQFVDGSFGLLSLAGASYVDAHSTLAFASGQHERVYGEGKTEGGDDETVANRFHQQRRSQVRVPPDLRFCPPELASCLLRREEWDPLAPIDLVPHPAIDSWQLGCTLLAIVACVNLTELVFNDTSLYDMERFGNSCPQPRVHGNDFGARGCIAPNAPRAIRRRQLHLILALTDADICEALNRHLAHLGTEGCAAVIPMLCNLLRVDPLLRWSVDRALSVAAQSPGSEILSATPLAPVLSRLAARVPTFPVAPSEKDRDSSPTRAAEDGDGSCTQTESNDWAFNTLIERALQSDSAVAHLMVDAAKQLRRSGRRADAARAQLRNAAVRLAEVAKERDSALSRAKAVTQQNGHLELTLRDLREQLGAAMTTVQNLLPLVRKVHGAAADDVLAQLVTEGAKLNRRATPIFNQHDTAQSTDPSLEAAIRQHVVSPSEGMWAALSPRAMHAAAAANHNQGKE